MSRKKKSKVLSKTHQEDFFIEIARKAIKLEKQEEEDRKFSAACRRFSGEMKSSVESWNAYRSGAYFKDKKEPVKDKRPVEKQQQYITTSNFKNCFPPWGSYNMLYGSGGETYVEYWIKKELQERLETINKSNKKLTLFQRLIGLIKNLTINKSNKNN